jgi:hypothetical protein
VLPESARKEGVHAEEDPVRLDVAQGHVHITSHVDTCLQPRLGGGGAHGRQPGGGGLPPEGLHQPGFQGLRVLGFRVGP